MANLDKSKPKILKAKKTMPTSCRKQVEILNKTKNVEALKTASTGSNVPTGNLNLSTGFIISTSRLSQNVGFSLDSNKNTVSSEKNTIIPQNLIKPVEENVDSETRLECVNEHVTCPNQKPRKAIDSPSKLCIQKAKDSWDTSESHFEYHTSVTSSFFEHNKNSHLKSIWWPPSLLSSILQMPKATEMNTLDDKRIDNMISLSKTSSKSVSLHKRQNDILSSDSDFVPVEKTPNLSSVSSSNCAAEVLKSEEYNKNCYSSISNCESTESEWQSSLDTDGNNSQNQKKRMFSENKENAKRMKTSEQINENSRVTPERQTALLEKVKHLIQQEICNINFKQFDNKLKELNERIEKMQCKNKHEAVANELFAKIAKLQRRIKAVLSSQSIRIEPNVSTNTAYKVTNLETMNLGMNCESVKSLCERMTSVNSEASEKINLSPDHVEFVSDSNSDDVMLVSVESPNLTTPITSNPTDLRKVTSENSSSSLNVETEVVAAEMRKLDCVIDLTKEGLPICDTESPVSTLESVLKAVLNTKETTPVAQKAAQNAAQVLDSFDHLPPLPEPPPLQPEIVDKIRDTLPPQKPELKVKRVLRPRGIALTWNISKINPKCAPVESYHLFLCHESSNSKLIWKKIGEIKALPLPMACTLSQFLASNKYYFTVQSKDIFGRYGPFCDIKSIPGFSENLT
nr:activating transcription factor 7-interacting protein 2 isoform X1 [Oryctolagus cuniculus]XP_008255922.1 activating transcription factor 7-interacting protein 2 isoform X1 [Oryctolagus cuniculus]XP_008255923.1 activating transcription factor 7-interacting protein 2 isoform X1 [Oryctolagus cuniculus]XP_008255926.1 activating transcription factor 7-interacting protein 2 isoform X1 [Oryctolagus cuniculus]XP_008255927.1 activating transcription factor 7-interacting protein 2 isoform X1 [Oryctola